MVSCWLEQVEAFIMGGRAALTHCWLPTPPAGTKASGATIVPNTTIVLASATGVTVTKAAAWSMGCGWQDEWYSANPTMTTVAASEVEVEAAPFSAPPHVSYRFNLAPAPSPFANHQVGGYYSQLFCASLR